MTVIGVIAEGPTDYLVLEAAIQRILPEAEVLPLHPEFDESGLMSGSREGVSFGWRGVKAFCQTISGAVDNFMRTDLNRPIDCLVVHVDCSMADKIGVERPCPDPMDTARALKSAVFRDWLGEDEDTGRLLIATPSKEIESWIVAGLQIDRCSQEHIECDKGVAMELVHAGILRMKNGTPKKSQRIYREFVIEFAQNWHLVASSCSTAADFENHMSQL